MSQRRWRDDIRVEAPGRASPWFVGVAKRVIGPIVRVVHRPTLEGAEHLPATGPFLLVSNHSGGMAISEVMCFVALYLEQLGAERPLAGFAHPLGLKIFPASVLFRHIGAIPSTYVAAESTLAAGVPILVFPGGDHEACRPIWQAHRVDLAGRKGFLRIAQKMNVPIVPLGIRGSHFTVPVLWRSRVLPWLLLTPRLGLGIKRWPITLLGAAGALAIALLAPWAWPWRALAMFIWLGSPFIFVPWVPWTIRFRIGAPIPPAELFSPALSDEESLARAYQLVEQRVQGLVDP